jgi:hypothetical protein
VALVRQCAQISEEEEEEEEEKIPGYCPFYHNSEGFRRLVGHGLVSDGGGGGVKCGERDADSMRLQCRATQQQAEEKDEEEEKARRRRRRFIGML